MIDPTVLPRRTDEGEAILRSRSADLSIVARNILVAVNGEKTVGDILYMFRGRDGAREALEDLFARGCVTADPGGAVASSEQARRLSILANQKFGPRAAPFVKRLRDLVNRDGSLTDGVLKELTSWARTMYGSKETDVLMEDFQKSQQNR